MLWLFRSAVGAFLVYSRLRTCNTFWTKSRNSDKRPRSSNGAVMRRGRRSVLDPVRVFRVAVRYGRIAGLASFESSTLATSSALRLASSEKLNTH